MQSKIICSSLIESFSTIRVFVAQAPISQVPFEEGGTMVLSADDPVTLTMGWSAFRFKRDEHGNLVKDEQGKKIEEGILATVPLARIKDDELEGVDGRLKDLMKTMKGRRTIAAWLMSGLEFSNFLASQSIVSQSPTTP